MIIYPPLFRLYWGFLLLGESVLPTNFHRLKSLKRDQRVVNRRRSVGSFVTSANDKRQI